MRQDGWILTERKAVKVESFELGAVRSQRSPMPGFLDHTAARGHVAGMDRARHRPPARWLTTADAAASLGVSQWWVRQRIDDGLVPAMAISTGRHKVYRIRDEDWANFCSSYTGDALDPRFE